MNKLSRIFFVPLTVIVFDQIFKFLATKSLLPQVGSFFETISCNSGIAFSIQLPTSAFVMLWFLSIAAILYLLKLERNNIGLLLVLGGAVSNIIDRIFIGCVVDYISLFNIPTFNFGDTAICLGISCFILRTFLKQKIISLPKQ